VTLSRAVSFVNGRVMADGGTTDSVRFASKIVALGERPQSRDVVVDLRGSFVLPGFVNAHDHLELNHYGRLKSRERYVNATQWIDDMRPRLSEDPAILTGRSHPLAERLFAGALKNLLSGVTLVAHHNPYYPDFRCGVPVRVLRRYGWAHSFALERQPAGARGEMGGGVAARWRTTPSTAPFFVHLAEGVDAAAGGELARLEALGCLKPNTVIVHGVAIDDEGWRRVAVNGAAFVWCPASNVFLFGRTAAISDMLRNPERPRIAIGTDSRITGARDLLDELRVARSTAPLSASEILAMATRDAADVLRQPRAGRIAVGLPADLVVVPALASSAGEAVLEASRKDLQLVVIDGGPLLGDPDFAADVFVARRVATRPLTVDGAEKLAAASLVKRISGCPIQEPGVTTNA
jgi:cytosine/adenosine deaminase-related metal-dependent hydrolase